MLNGKRSGRSPTDAQEDTLTTRTRSALSLVQGDGRDLVLSAPRLTPRLSEPAQEDSRWFPDHASRRSSSTPSDVQTVTRRSVTSAISTKKPEETVSAVPVRSEKTESVTLSSAQEDSLERLSRENQFATRSTAQPVKSEEETDVSKSTVQSISSSRVEDVPEFLAEPDSLSSREPVSSSNVNQDTRRRTVNASSRPVQET